MTRDIPKPSFKTCDETSLTLKWEGIANLEESDSLRLEYKLPNDEWVAENSVAIEKGEGEASIVEVIDLEPGNKMHYLEYSGVVTNLNILYYVCSLFCSFLFLAAQAHLTLCALW